jgi:hypothetical protein
MCGAVGIDIGEFPSTVSGIERFDVVAPLVEMH